MNAANLDKSKRLQNDIQEEWRPVVGYEMHYEVSNYGEVRSLDRFVKRKNGGVTKKTGRLLKKHIGRTGYYEVTLCDNGKHRTTKVHRVVGIAFIDNPENRREINHLDEDKLNNYVLNLEWATPKENSNHSNAKIYKFIMPCGTKILILNLKDYCLKHGLAYTSMQYVHNGMMAIHRGWTKWVD